MKERDVSWQIGQFCVSTVVKGFGRAGALESPSEGVGSLSWRLWGSQWRFKAVRDLLELAR